MKAIHTNIRTKFKTVLSQGALAAWRALQHFNLLLRRHKQVLGLYSYKTIVRRSGTFGVVGLVALTTTVIFPMARGNDSVEAYTSAQAEPTIGITASNATASVDLLVLSESGTVATSAANGANAAFSVNTNNHGGYTLSIKSSSTSTDLTGDNGGQFTSISSAATSADNIDNGKWGYLPSKYNSSANTSYLPSPNNTGSTLAKTTQASTDSYTIGIAAKADYSKIAGTYSNTYTLTAVVNSFDYKITFNKGNTTDAVTVPNPVYQNATTDSYVSLSSVTSPTRTGYTFAGWCSVMPTVSGLNSSTCSGASYRTGTNNATNPTYYFSKAEDNSDITLYAMWTINKYEVTLNRTNVDSVTFTTSSSDTTNCPTISGATATKVSLCHGVSYTITMAPTSGYEFESWATAANGTLGSTSSASTTYAVTGTSTLTAKAKQSGYTITFKTSNAQSIIFNNVVYTDGQSVTLSATTATYNLCGNYASKYGFSSWNVTAGTLADGTLPCTRYTVTGSATITLTGKSVSTKMQNLAYSSCTTTPTPVYDERDGHVYYVQRLADNKCWMLENLDFDIYTYRNSISSSNTNVSGVGSGTGMYYLLNGGGSTSDKYATGALASNTWTSSYSYSVPMIKVNPATPTAIYGAGQTGAEKVGTYYNYCAATLGSYCYGNGTSYGTSSGNADANYDVCPAGWRMPNGNTSGEYQALYAAYSSDKAQFIPALRVPLSGYFYDGSQGYVGSNGYFWSSTRGNDYNMYILYVGTSSVNPASSYYRYGGFSVRCLLKATS